MSKQNTEKVWPIVFLGGLVILLAVVLGRCWRLQYHQNEQFARRAERQQKMLIRLPARRGPIVDRNGNQMAISVRVASVAVDPLVAGDLAQVAKRLGAILGQAEDELLTRLQVARQAHKRFVWVKRFISSEQADQLTANLPSGVIVQHEFQRRYPMGKLAGHVLGFTDIDGRGLEGAEAYYDEYLAGRDGELVLCKDVLKRPIGAQQPGRPAQDGQTLALSLDANVQEIVERHLEATAQKFQAASAAAIVMDPQTGEVLALANWPGFDPAQGGATPVELRRNRVLTDPVEPGSTFKPFTVAAALEGGYVRADDKIDCLTEPYRGKGIGRIGEYRDYFGKISVAEVIMRSSNIGAAKIAQKMGKDYFHNMIVKFGFGRRTGIDLGGEGAGILRPLSQWKWGQYALTRAAYGQGPVATTPIQLMRAFCCFANGGQLVQPRIGRWVIDGRQIVKDCSEAPEVLTCVAGESRSTEYTGRPGGGQRPVSRQVAGQMSEQILTGVVARVGGTAHNAALAGYTVFGKTGTAKIAKKDQRGYEDNKYVSSFIAGAPAEKPRICLLVMVREPDRSLGLGYTGGAVAAPAVREIVRETLGYMGVPPKNAEMGDLALLSSHN